MSVVLVIEMAIRAGPFADRALSFSGPESELCGNESSGRCLKSQLQTEILGLKIST